jgi:menaquinone-dependent protoporphyrinogen IX oxidase
MKALVTAASRHGATGEIAAVIAKVLASSLPRAS